MCKAKIGDKNVSVSVRPSATPMILAQKSRTDGHGRTKNISIHKKVRYITVTHLLYCFIRQRFVVLRYLHCTIVLLMCVAEEIVDSLHWVEGLKWNFYEDCVPIAHGAIPKTWELKCLKVLAVL